MAYMQNLTIGLSTIFGWVPSLVLVCFSLLAVFSGVANLFTQEFTSSISSLILGVLGLLGFWALTSVCWGVKLNFVCRFYFLIAGITSLFIATSYLIYSSSKGNLHDDATLFIFMYIFVSPLVVGVYHLVLHIKYIKRVT